ncbi:MAG: hypothetical protein VKO21_03875 [Candidatus Sericytochromatia bacterium]|nr:hypothetical protein [Candidatus Sericytochromatia bacterium]
MRWWSRTGSLMTAGLLVGCPQVPGTGENLMPLSAIAVTDTSGRRIELSWGEVPTIPRYEVVRVDGSQIKVLTAGPARSHVDRDALSANASYIYVIRALDGANAERWRTTSPGIRPAETPLEPPDGLKVLGATPSADPLPLSRTGRLSWDPVPEAVLYHLAFRRENGESLFEDLVTSPSWPAEVSETPPAHWPIFRPRGDYRQLPADTSLDWTLTALAPVTEETIDRTRALRAASATRRVRLVD